MSSKNAYMYQDEQNNRHQEIGGKLPGTSISMACRPPMHAWGLSGLTHWAGGTEAGKVSFKSKEDIVRFFAKSWTWVG